MDKFEILMCLCACLLLDYVLPVNAAPFPECENISLIERKTSQFQYGCTETQVDLCIDGRHLRVPESDCSQPVTEEICVPCEGDTYLNTFNKCDFCKQRTRCGPNEIESPDTPPSVTADRKCIPKPPPTVELSSGAPCPTETSPAVCPPCPSCPTPSPESKAEPTTEQSSSPEGTTENGNVGYQCSPQEEWTSREITLLVLFLLSLLIHGIVYIRCCRRRPDERRYPETSTNGNVRQRFSEMCPDDEAISTRTNISSRRCSASDSSCVVGADGGPSCNRPLLPNEESQANLTSGPSSTNTNDDQLGQTPDMLSLTSSQQSSESVAAEDDSSNSRPLCHNEESPANSASGPSSTNTSGDLPVQTLGTLPLTSSQQSSEPVSADAARGDSKRVTDCTEDHINFVTDNISIKKHQALFAKLKLDSKQVERVMHDHRADGIDEQIRAVLKDCFRERSQDTSIWKLLQALEDSGHMDVRKDFQETFHTSTGFVVQLPSHS